MAALSGVDVQLVLSQSNNQHLTRWAQRSYYEELLEAGVRIALYRPHFLHAKHLSVDDDIALIGSINLDIRSFALNAEAGLLCYDAAVVARLREIEADYLADAQLLDLAPVASPPALASQRGRHGAVGRLADVAIGRTAAASPRSFYTRRIRSKERRAVIPGWILLLVSVGYVGLLFAVAYYGDQRGDQARARWLRPAVYSLALAVYCSSWTFYGAVGTRRAHRAGLPADLPRPAADAGCSAGASSNGWC